MAFRYTRINRDDGRLHQAKIDLEDSKKPAKTKPVVNRMTSGAGMYARFDEGDYDQKTRRFSRVSFNAVKGKKALATHNFGFMSRYDCMDPKHKTRIEKLFEIKNKEGDPAHRRTDDRVAWVSGWIVGKNMEKLEEDMSTAFEFLETVWTTPTFCTFFSPDEARALIYADSASWMLRLSTTFPRIIRITTRKTNEGISPDTALKIHWRREGIHRYLLEAGVLESLHTTVTDYLGPRLGF